MINRGYKCFKKLEVRNNKGQYYEFEAGDSAIVSLEDRSSMTVEIQNMNDYKLIVIDEDGFLRVILFQELENIEPA